MYDNGVCYVGGRQEDTVSITCHDVVTGSGRTVAALDKEPFQMGFSVSPDGPWILVTRVDRNESDLMMVENFK